MSGRGTYVAFLGGPGGTTSGEDGRATVAAFVAEEVVISPGSISGRRLVNREDNQQWKNSPAVEGLPLRRDRRSGRPASSEWWESISASSKGSVRLNPSGVWFGLSKSEWYEENEDCVVDGVM